MRPIDIDLRLYTETPRVPQVQQLPQRKTPIEVHLEEQVDVAVLPMRFELERIRVRPWMRPAPGHPSAGYGQWTVEMTCKVLDVAAGQPIHVSFNQVEYAPNLLEMAAPERNRLIARMVRSALLKMMEHEVSECVMANGKPLVEPHPERYRGG